MKVGDKVFVVDWGKAYSNLTKWNSETHQRENIFPIKTKIPDYSGIDHHWKYIYEPNLTLKGTVNKREPKKLVDKIPVYKDYKWKILEIVKHPKAGEYYYNTEEQRVKWGYGKYSEEDFFLLVSMHTDKEWLKCYTIVSEKGISFLTSKQFANEKFNALIEANLGKWDRNTLIKENLPKEIKSVFYDENDRVLFGSHVIRGLVFYEYLESKFSTDGKPIYLGCSILYDGEGNKKCPNPELIKPFTYIKAYIESN